MTRNIDYRIEVATPLLDPRLKQRVLDIIDILFSDTVKARYIDKELSNRYVPAAIAAKYGRSWRFTTTSNHSNNLNNPMPIHDKSPRPQEFAAVDLGSNSFHMVIARVVDGAMQIIGRLKQRVHLADGLGPDNMLSEEAMTRGLNCLSLFAERLQGFSPASVCIVGTHTLRQALNATDFLKRAEKVIPYPIEIISGNEEARLIFMGVEHTQPEKGRKLVIDIGGGSTELVIGENFEPILVESRRMGCVSFAQLYFLAGSSIKRIFSALAWRQHKNWKR